MSLPTGTIIPVAPIFGGQVSLLYGLETTPGTAAATVSPAGFVNIPGVTRPADMDKVFPLGTYLRQQKNMTDYKPSFSVRQHMQDIGLLASGLRDGSGLMGSYTFVFGNAAIARIATGCKCASLELDIPRDGPVMANFQYEALNIQPYASAPAAMTYSSGKALYGYGLSLLSGGNDYTQFFRRVRINPKQTLTRGMPTLVNIGTSGSPIYIVQSQFIKETIQEVELTFDLYEPMGVQDVSDVCRATFNAVAYLWEPCSNTYWSVTLPDIQFNTDNLEEGDMQQILQFSATADAQSIVVAVGT